MLSVFYDENGTFKIIMLSVVMLSAAMLSADMLILDMLNVVIMIFDMVLPIC